MDEDPGVSSDPYVGYFFPNQVGHRSVFSGTRWTSISQVGTQTIKFGVAIILARLLVPQDFGLMAMALVVIGFVEIFKDLGTVAAIIQRKELTSDLLSSLFFFNALVGLVAGAAIALLAPTLAWIYRDPRLTPIIQVLAVTFFISSFGLVKRALLTREMRFGRLALIELTTAGTQGAAAVALALLGWRVWSLVGGAITGSIILTVLSWLAVSWRPRVHFKLTEIKTIFHFSLNLTGAQVFNYFIFNADSLIIGRFLGATPLGFYNLTQRLILTPVRFVTKALTKVLLPAFSRIQDDNAQICDKYLRACAGISLITFPLLAGLCTVARPFVLLVFGVRWSPAIPLIMILAPVGMIQSIATTAGVIYMVKGRTDWLLWWQIASGILTTLAFICGLPWGAVGVALAYGIVITLLAYPAFAIPFRLIDLKFIQLLSALRPYATATAIMVSLVLGCRIVSSGLGLETRFVLVLSLLTGVIGYAAIILLMRPPALDDLQKMFLLAGLLRRFRNSETASRP